jgi:hypothetical protein
VKAHDEVTDLGVRLSRAQAKRVREIERARVDGFSLNEIAVEIGLSRSRVAQLANIERKREERRAAKRRFRDERRRERQQAAA